MSGAMVHGMVITPACKGDLPLHYLQELNEDEYGAEDANRERDAHAVRRAEAAVLEQGERQQRVGCAALPEQERDDQ